MIEKDELNIFVLPDSSLHLEWTETDENISKSQTLFQKELHNRFTDNPVEALLFLACSDKSLSVASSLSYWRHFADLFVQKVSLTPNLEQIRHKVNILPDEDELQDALDMKPVMTGSEYIDKALLLSVWKGLNNRFVEKIKAYKGTVEELIQKLSPDIHLVGRVYFHLVENKDENFPFAFLSTYSTGFGKKGQSKHLPLKAALAEYGKDSDKLFDLLVTVHQAASESEMIRELLESGELFMPLTWTTGEAYTFLKETPLYEKSGILCRIPNWWKSKSSHVSFNISVGNKIPSSVGMESILDFEPELLIGDMVISREEIQKLLNESDGLVFIKNKWVEVDPEKLKQTLEAYEKAQKLVTDGGLTLKEALRLQLNPESVLNLKQENSEITVSNGEWFDGVLSKLRNPDMIKSVKPDSNFNAVLREYQQKGLNWFTFLHSLQFGACLADDMGLGKTVQLLAFLAYLKSQNKETSSSLLIIPASLISNWADEIEKFLPQLEYFIAHPQSHTTKKVEPQTKESLDRYDLVITTYALAQRYEWLNEYSWHYVILDEGQAIKNPGTKQTKAVKKFKAYNRIVMTGTPVENRLSDIWSIFDFLNPGLLGNVKEFTKFTKNLDDDPSGYSRLRKLISPYILRRSKRDKSVISDLPDKIEMKTYSDLSKKQVLLYKNYVDKLSEMLKKSENGSGIERKGLILSSIIKFKQLCNHPDQFMGTGDYEEKHSGKFQRLREICETIVEKREKLLLFTQFKEITEYLSIFLETIFQYKGLVLHGSTPIGKRKKIISEFQSSEYVPFIVLSLKAGGVGLNLTAANHVIHFDRWWNPAVENQATDRAFRIGQKKNVMVHKFLTKGTIEEKIDMMLEDKQNLSNDIIKSSGQSLITEMNNNQLKELFKLRL